METFVDFFRFDVIVGFHLFYLQSSFYFIACEVTEEKYMKNKKMFYNACCCYYFCLNKTTYKKLKIDFVKSKIEFENNLQRCLLIE
jgi:hypothetical protein